MEMLYYEKWNGMVQYERGRLFECAFENTYGISYFLGASVALFGWASGIVCRKYEFDSLRDKNTILLVLTMTEYNDSNLKASK